MWHMMRAMAKRVVVASLVLCGVAGDCRNAASGQPLAQAEFDGWKTPSLYQYGTDLLKRGRNFDRAILALTLAAQREPANVDYQLALGCGYASRFASIGFAVRQAESFSTEWRNYENLKAEWDKAQQDSGDPLFGKSAPPIPTRPTTPDDNRAFGMSRDAVAPILRDLGRKCLAAFDEAHRLVEALSSEKRCEVEFTRGWGLSLVRRFGKGVVEDRPKRTVKAPSATDTMDDHLYLEQVEVSDCFRRCTEEDPKNADYWQSLGLSLVPRVADAGNEGTYAVSANGSPIHTARDTEEAAEAFRRALLLKPKEFDLLYQAAHVAAGSNAAQAEGYLERATQRIGSNAVLWYLLADMRYRQADGLEKKAAAALQAKALAAVEAGNRAPRYAAVPFALPVPPLLRRAWDYSRLYGLGEDAYTVMTVCMQIREVAKQQIAEGDSAGTMRGMAASMAMGLKVLRHCDCADLDLRDPRMRSLRKTRPTMGAVACYAAYDSLKDLQKAHPGPAVTRLMAEYRKLIPKLMELDREYTRIP
jgi:hypothetical protein